MKLKELQKLKVKNDKDLLPQERETHFYITDDDNSKLKITSSQKKVIEHLLKCDDLKVERYYTDDNGNLVQLEGILPISYIKFKSEGRTRNYLSRILY